MWLLLCENFYNVCLKLHISASSTRVDRLGTNLFTSGSLWTYPGYLSSVAIENAKDGDVVVWIVHEVHAILHVRPEALRGTKREVLVLVFPELSWKTN